MAARARPCRGSTPQSASTGRAGARDRRSAAGPGRSTGRSRTIAGRRAAARRMPRNGSSRKKPPSSIGESFAAIAALDAAREDFAKAAGEEEAALRYRYSEELPAPFACAQGHAQLSAYLDGVASTHASRVHRAAAALIRYQLWAGGKKNWLEGEDQHRFIGLIADVPEAGYVGRCRPTSPRSAASSNGRRAFSSGDSSERCRIVARSRACSSTGRCEGCSSTVPSRIRPRLRPASDFEGTRVDQPAMIQYASPSGVTAGRRNPRRRGGASSTKSRTYRATRRAPPQLTRAPAVSCPRSGPRPCRCSPRPSPEARSPLAARRGGSPMPGADDLLEM